VKNISLLQMVFLTLENMDAPLSFLFTYMHLTPAGAWGAVRRGQIKSRHIQSFCRHFDGR
jgi:hypothetical protein